MSKISLTLAISLIIVAGLLGTAVGYAMTPEYKSEMYEKNTMSLGRADKKFDLRYINAMIAHHRGAMLLAEQAKDLSQRTEIKELAVAILKDEPKAINDLFVLKKELYGDERRVQDPAVSNLGVYDEKFDLRFLNALIAHHEIGLEMTKETSEKSSRTEILNNADAVDTFLETTLKVFMDWRKQWYGI